jgi:pyrimidine-specific ribonucleoside hydrolase
MLYPEKFSVKLEAGEPERISAVCNPGSELAATILEVLESDREDKSILFSRFPMDPALFEEDVAAIAEDVMKRHGFKEWKIVVLTNEFHEHLGAYSILGAKMGLRAREYFHVGIDEVTIQSLAGSTPPVSCMNDGLQVSTGATLGHGTITILKGDAMPAARFAFKNRVVELSVRPEIRVRIRKDVRYGVETYGFQTTEYWAYIRELALNYWLELSRFEIFDIIEKTGAIASY